MNEKLCKSLRLWFDGTPTVYKTIQRSRKIMVPQLDRKGKFLGLKEELYVTNQIILGECSRKAVKKMKRSLKNVNR